MPVSKDEEPIRYSMRRRDLLGGLLGADVELWTKEQPPLLNKVDISILLPQFGRR